MALIDKLKAIADAIRAKTDKSEELTLEQMASEIEGITTGGANLEERQVVIDTNGTTTITPSEGFDGLSKVEVDVVVIGEGFDLSLLGWSEESISRKNQILKDEFTRAIERAKLWTETATSSNFWGGSRTGRMFYYYTKLNCPNLTTLNLFSYCHAMSYINIDDAVENCNNLISCNNAFQGDYMLREVNLGHIDYSKVTMADSMFASCWNIEKIDWGKFKDAKLLSMVHMFNDACFKFETMDFSNITTKYCEKMNSMFYYSGGSFSQKTKSIIGLDMTSCINATSIFNNRTGVTYIEIKNWGKCDLSLNTQNLLSSSSIHYIIQNAMDVAEGATARILTLHATAKTNWQNSEYYNEDLAVLEQKGITIA